MREPRRHTQRLPHRRSAPVYFQRDLRSVKIPSWFFVAVLNAPLVAAPAAVHLTPGVPVVVPPGTTAPVRMAVEDLQRYLLKVLGCTYREARP